MSFASIESVNSVLQFSGIPLYDINGVSMKFSLIDCIRSLLVIVSVLFSVCFLEHEQRIIKIVNNN